MDKQSSLGKFTQGPWKADKYMVYSADGKEIVNCDEAMGPDTDNEVLANAHLIASAPELLEAVKKLHNEYAHQGKGYWAGTGQAIERLINHAEGKA